MSFKALAGTTFKSVQQIQDAAQLDFRLLGPSPETIAQKVGEFLPDGYPVPPKNDPARVQRRERTQLMQQKFVSVLTAMYQGRQERPDKGSYDFPRDIDMVLTWLCPDKKSYEDCRDTMLGKDPREKATAILDALKSYQDELKRLEELHLSTITDQQVAENFESLFKMGQVTEQLEALTKNRQLAFTPEEREWLMSLEQKYGAAGFSTFTRAEVIASGYYELFPPERFIGMDILDLTDQLGDDVGRGFTDYLESRVNPNFNFMGFQWQNEIENHGMRGYAAEEIVWMDQDGQELEPDLNKDQTILRAPVSELRMGRPLIAKYPDGQIRVFTGSMKGDDFGMRTQGPEALVEQDMKKSLDDLSHKLDKAQPTLMLTGSKEYKNVRSAIEKVQKNLQTLGNNPTSYQKEQLRKQMEELEKVSQAYLTYKGTEEGKNAREQRRIDAVKAVRAFAKRKLAQLDILDQKGVIAAEAEAMGGLKEGKGTWRSEQHQARMSAAPQQDAKAQAELEKAKANLKKYVTERELTVDDPDLNRAKNKAQYLQKLVSYNNNTIPRSNAAFNVGKMHQDTAGRIARMMNQMSNAPLTGASAQNARTALAQMILVEMVMKERRETKPDLDTGLIKAGLLESFLGHDIAGKSGETMMLQNIQNSQAFLEMTENLSGKSFRDFFMEDKVQNFSDKVMEELFPHKEQIKAAQEEKFKAPEKAPEKSPEEMLKAYKESKIPRSNAAFDVEGLHQDTVGRIAIALKLSSDAPLTGASAQEARTTIAQMILLDLVQKERGDAKPDLKTGQIQAGPLESSLGRDIAGKSGLTMMLQNIQNSESFLEMTKDLNGMSVKDFFTANKAKNVSEKVMEELFPHKEQIKAAQDAQSKSPEEMLNAYKESTFPRSNAAFDVEGLHQDTVGRIAIALKLSSDAPLNAASAQDARTTMAQMILLDLVRKERGDAKPDLETGLIKAGPLESYLDRDIAGKSGLTMMLQNIQNSESFLEMTQELTGMSVKDFFTANKAQNVSEKIMEELFPHKEQIKSIQETQNKLSEEMLQSYKKIRLPRSSERVEGLYQNTVERITPLLTPTSYAPLNAASAQEVRTAMAQMILVDMVLKERVSNMFDPSNSKMKVGPLESFLDRDIAGKPGMTMMLQNIQNSESFTEMTKDLTGNSFQNFFLENKARNVSGKILAELFPHKEQIKTAQQTQVKKAAVQNAPKVPKQNAPQVGGK